MEVKHLALYILLPLVLLVIISLWLYGPGGAFGGVKKVADKVKGFLPNVTLGAKELQAEKPSLPPYHEQTVRRLVDAIQNMVKSDRQHCFENYGGGGLPPLEENKGTVIRLSAGSITTFTLGGRQEITDLNRELSEKLKGFQPCVVAGVGAEKFAELFLNEEPWTAKKAEIERQYTNRAEQPPFFVVNELVIQYDGENKINFGYGDKDLEDGGMLYSPAKGLVCFFPTVDVIQNVDKYDGLNDDEVKGSRSVSLPIQLREKRLPPCTGQWEEKLSVPIVSTPEQTLPGGVG